MHGRRAEAHAPHLLQVKTAIMSLGDLLAVLSVVSWGSLGLCKHPSKGEHAFACASARHTTDACMLTRHLQSARWALSPLLALRKTVACVHARLPAPPACSWHATAAMPAGGCPSLQGSRAGV
jgi:hypothetical protein